MNAPVQPTQARHPWRATVRTIVAAVVGLALLGPLVAAELGVQSVPWAAGVLAVIGAVTRVLAIPGVEAWMRQYVPWLSAEPSKEE